MKKERKGFMAWNKFKETAGDLRDGFQPSFITREELKKHTSEKDCWLAIKGIVYNVTSFLEYHPGGASYLVKFAGTDATPDFLRFHSWIDAEEMLKTCIVGWLT